MKKLLALVLAVVMLLGCTALADEAARKKDVVILFTSDVHCGVENGYGYVGLDVIRNNLVLQKNEVLMVDVGDSVQGAPIGTMTEGETIINLMNSMEYDVATIGNHEFDYGMNRFFELREMADFPYISCNFNYKGSPVLDPYVIKEADGLKIAFVGISTPKTLTSSTPSYFKEDGEFVYDFSQDETGAKLYETVQKAVDAARAEGVDYVFAMGHVGIEAECQPYTSLEIIANTNGIDVFLDGHSHSILNQKVANKDGADVLHVACGTQMECIGRVTIKQDGSMVPELYTWGDPKHTFDTTFGVLTPATFFVSMALDELDIALSEVLAHTDVDLTINDPEKVGENDKPIRAIRNAETNLGDLCADAYRTLGDADIGIVNGGGIRANLYKGDITKKDALTVHPYGNSLCVVECSGQEVLDALEFSVHSYPGEFGGWLQVSGLTFELHSYLPSTVKMDEASMFVGVEGEYRVKNVMVGGEPLDLNKTYTLACHNYLLKSMGDGYTLFADNVLTQDCIMLDNQVLIKYINSLGDSLGELYSNLRGQGRIIIVDEAPAK